MDKNWIKRNHRALILLLVILTSDFLMPSQASFDGGGPLTSPGDGFVAPSIQLTDVTGFESFPDDCSFLGGRF
jgi:hypothetical protein